MMKWFRKHNKQLLAVFASLLLVVWLGGSALERLFQRDPYKATIGSAFGEPITAAQAAGVKARLRVLESLGVPWMVPWRNPWVNEQLGLPDDLRQDPILMAGAQPLNENDPTEWWLLVQEANRMGVTISNEEIQRFLQDRGLTGEQLTLVRDNARISTEALYDVIAEYLRVSYAAVLASAGVQVTDAEAKEVFIRANEQVGIRYAILPAEAFKPAEPPTEAQLQELFEQYKDNPPGSGRYGFGYKHPLREVIEYAGGSIDQIARALPEPSDESVRRHFERHRAEFQPPLPPGTQPAATQPEVTLEQVRDQVVQAVRMDRAAGRLREAIERIRRDVFSEYTRAKASLEAGQVPPSLESVMEQAVRDAQQALGIPLIYRKTEPLTQEQAAQEPLISQAFVLESQNRQLPFAEYAFRAAGQQADGSALQLRPYQPSSELRDVMGAQTQGRYIFRVIEVLPSEAPSSLDEVRERVVQDAIALAGMRQAQEAAEKLAAAAREVGLQEAFNQQFPALATQPTTTQPGAAGQIKLLAREDVTRTQLLPLYWAMLANRLTIPTELPGMPGPETGSDLLIEAAFNLASSATTQPARPVTVVEAPEAKACAVVELEAHTPATEQQYAEVREMLTAQLRMMKLREFYANWFNPQAIAQRTGWQPVAMGPAPQETAAKAAE